MDGEILWWNPQNGPVTYWFKLIGEKVRIDEPIGVAGEPRADGSVPVILNDRGRALFGPNAELVIAPPEPEADQPIIIEGNE